MSLVVSVLLAALLGFSAHRAGICTVKAVAELLSTRRPYLIISFAKTSAWVVAISSLAAGLSFDARFLLWPLTWYGVIGGLVFGVGAGINGGCIFSTLARVCDGNLNMLAAVLMWPAGAILEIGFMQPYVFEAGYKLIPGFQQSSTLYPTLRIGLAAWVVWELIRLLVTRSSSTGLRSAPGTNRFRLSSAAALIGISNAIIFYNYQNWSFTTAVLISFAPSGDATRTNIVAIWALVLAAIGGMLFSSFQRRSFMLSVRDGRAIIRHAAGGAMMGVGAAMIPGGNDSLILFGMPTLSPHAFPSYVAIICGITLVFFVMRLRGKELPQVVCTADVCITGATADAKM